MNNTKTVVLGRLPAFIGYWEPNHSYYKFNKVVYEGAEFTSTVDGNSNVPAEIDKEDGVVVSYTLNPGWLISSNPYDAAIYMKSVIDEIDKDYEFTPGYMVVEDSSYVNPQYKYVKYNSQQLTTEEKAQARANIGAVGREILSGVAYYDVIETL